MHAVRMSVVVALCCGLLAGPVCAEGITDLWISPNLEEVSALATDPVDGSCWVANAGGLVHLSPDGHELWRGGYSRGLDGIGSIAVNPADRSVWVAAFQTSAVVHLAADGTELGRVPVAAAARVSLNTTDGSVWAIGTGWTDTMSGETVPPSLTLINADATVRWSGLGYPPLTYLVADPTDGSCVLSDGVTHQLVRVGPDGSELWRGGSDAVPIALNPQNHTIWLNDATHLVLVDATGRELWRSEWDSSVIAAAVDPRDDSCWTLHASTNPSSSVIHLAPDGSLLSEWAGYGWLTALAPSPADGSVWVQDDRRLIHAASDGSMLWHSLLYTGPTSLAVDPNNETVWVGLEGTKEVVHLDGQGGELKRIGGFGHVAALALNPNDDSVWVGDDRAGYLVHLASDGTEVSRTEVKQAYGINYIASMAVNPTNDRVAASQGTAGGYEFNADGTIVWAPALGGYLDLAYDPTDGSLWGMTSTSIGHAGYGAGPFLLARSIAVNPGDHTAWLADKAEAFLYHFDANCTRLLRITDNGAPIDVAVDPVDNSCWAANSWESRTGELTHVRPNGWMPYWGPAGEWALFWPHAVAVDPKDQTLWVIGVNTIAHLRPSSAHFSDVPDDAWGADEIAACALNGVVAGYADGTYQPGETVTRAQMAAYIARAVYHGEGQLPQGTPAQTFSDVPPSYWAFRYIDAAVAARVVQGYEDGTYQPDEPVTRAQMAVYIARALAVPTGDAAVPSGPETATFEDVPNTGYGESGTDPYWAYKYIEYCVDQGVVQGYDPTHYWPEVEVTRDQMAVFVARAFHLLP